MPRKNIKKYYQNKTKKKIVNVNDNEENFNKEISLYNDKHDDSIDLDRVDQPK